jgi:hypothetical protein
VTYSTGYPTSGFGPGGIPPYPGQPSHGQTGRFRDIPANWGWAVVGVIFFWPIGIAAVKAAGRVLPALLDGDAESAVSDSRRARKLGIIALCISLGAIALYVVFVVVILATAIHSCQGPDGC